MMDMQRRGYFQKRISRFTGYFILFTVTILISLPIIALILGSLKQDHELMVYPIQILPEEPQWANYARVFTMTPFLQVATRTFTLALVTATIGTFINSMVGYGFARFKVAGSSFLFGIVIAMLIVPGIVTMIPQFLIYARLKLTGTYWPWIIASLAGSSFNIFLFRQFFLSFPVELEEAAEVDGANPFRIFLQIFLPNAKPVLATVMFFSFLAVWGDYLTPLIYLNDNNTLLGVKLATGFKNPQGITLTTVSMAANVLYVLPMIVVFFILQRNILKGVVTSGLKG
jgi:ABC-type glycerol-3-phosphate transport system permease component